jgi:methylase of polypeptide subunit release factors
VPPGRWGDLDRYGAIEGSGDDGLDLLRALAVQARDVLRPGGRLIVQIGRPQWGAFAEELRSLGYVPTVARGDSASDVIGSAVAPYHRGSPP